MDKEHQPPTRRPPPGRRSQIEVYCAGVGWFRLVTIYPTAADAERERRDYYLGQLGRLPAHVRTVPADQ